MQCLRHIAFLLSLPWWWRLLGSLASIVRHCTAFRHWSAVSCVSGILLSQALLFMLQPFDYGPAVFILFPVLIYTILVMRTGLGGFCHVHGATLWQWFACWPLAFLLSRAVFQHSNHLPNFSLSFESFLRCSGQVSCYPWELALSLIAMSLIQAFLEASAMLAVAYTYSFWL